MIEIRDSWKKVPVLDAATMIRGVTYKRPQAKKQPQKGFVPVVRANNIGEYDWDFSDLVYVPSTLVKPEQFIRSGDVVIATSSGSINVVGKAAFAKEDLSMAFGAFCGLLRPSAEFHPRFFAHFFSTNFYRTTISSLARGVNINNIKKSHFLEIEIPKPPIEEQKQIADKLDVLLARVGACRERLERVPDILKRLRQSVLAVATASVDKQMTSVTLGECLETIKTGPFGSSLHKSDYIENGIPVINPMHIIEARLVPSQSMTISASTRERLSDFTLKEGDVVIGRRGVMGRCAVVQRESDGWLCGTGSMILRTNSQLLPEYLQLFLSSPSTVGILEADSVGSTMVNLNQKILRSLTIGLPSLKEQSKRIQAVEKVKNLTSNAEMRLTNLNSIFSAISPAILDRAFLGELISQ